MSLTAPQQPGTALLKAKHSPVAPPALSTPWAHPARSQHLPPALPRADNKLINEEIKVLVSLWCPTASPEQLGKQQSTGHGDPELRTQTRQAPATLSHHHEWEQ